jgi:hypothetical protein
VRGVLFPPQGSDPRIYPLVAYWAIVLVLLTLFYRPEAATERGADAPAAGGAGARAGAAAAAAASRSRGSPPASSPKGRTLVPVIILRKFFHGVVVVMLVPSLWVRGLCLVHRAR